MQESSLHAALKTHYARSGGLQEVPVDGYLVDVVRQGLLIEIQTGNFTAIKDKLKALLDNHHLLLVYPVAQEKWIVRLPSEGNAPIGRRRSPKRGRVAEIFRELVRIPSLMTHPNLSLEVLLVREEEIRRNDGQGSWRRKGWSIIDHRLLEIVHSHLFQTPQDLLTLIPESLPEPFTSKDLAAAMGVPRYLAQKAAYCLRNMQVITITGRRGRSYLYTYT
jgi:hypothetical protein